MAPVQRDLDPMRRLVSGSGTIPGAVLTALEVQPDASVRSVKGVVVTLRPPLWAGRLGFLTRGTALLVLAGLVSLGLGLPAAAQEESAPPRLQEEFPPGAAGLGTLEFNGRQQPLPFSLTALGDLVDLRTVVVALGATLEVGPLGESHEVTFAGGTAIVGPDSGVATLGERIIPLTRTPLLSLEGLQVPIDFFDKVMAEASGLEFSWDRLDRVLRVRARQARAYLLAIEAVHLAGSSTVVLRFDQEPRFRVDDSVSGQLILRFPGDTLQLVGRLPAAAGLLRRVNLSRDEVRIELAPGAVPAEPYRLGRGSSSQLVVDLVAGSRRAPSARRSLNPNRQLGGLRVVLDPGHGGDEVGAVGAAGTLEKDVTLLLARALRGVVEARTGARVILTRETDVAIPHDTRTAIANQYEAALFVSIHLNSLPGGGGRGAETYFWDPDAAAAMPGEEGDGEEDPLGLGLMLWDLAQSRHLAESQRLAKLIQAELDRTLGLRDRGVKQAPFRVLNGATMPAVLVELGFLSNPEEESRLLDADYRRQLVEALGEAIAVYLQPVNQPSVAPVDRGNAERKAGQEGQQKASGRGDDPGGAAERRQ